VTTDYAVHILWHCSDTSEWELETRHTGFASTAAAALFANALGMTARLQSASEDAVVFFMDGGRRLEVARGAAALRRLRKDAPAFAVVGDADYEPSAVLLSELVHGGVDRWGPTAYAVIGPSGPVEIELVCDEWGELVIRESGSQTETDLDGGDPLLVIIDRD